MKVLWLLTTFVLGSSGAGYLQVSPSTKAVGVVPRYFRVTLTLASTAVATAIPVAGATAQIQYSIGFTGLTTPRGAAHSDTLFSPFVRSLSPQAFLTTAVAFPAAPGAPVIVAPAAATVGDFVLTAHELSGPATCGNIVAYTSADGLTLTLMDLNGCLFIAGAGVPVRQWELTIPQIYLAPNAPYPEVLNNYRLVYTAAGNVLISVPASVPWTTIATELIASNLIFHRIDPDTTIQNAVVNSLFVSFTPGEQLTGGMSIALVVKNQPGTATGAAGTSPNTAFFAALAGLPAGTNLPAVPIGVDGCNSQPDIYCCSSTTVSQPGGNTDVLVFTLQPRGCALPAGKYVAFTVPAIFLTRNQLITNVAGLNANPLSIVLNAMLVTGGDQDGTFVALNGRPYQDPTNIPNPPNSMDLDGKGTQAIAAITALGAANYIGAWAIGLTVVSGFTATPDTFTTGVIPGQLVLSWVLSTGITTGVITAGASATPPYFIITANPGVFRRNWGSVYAQKTFTGVVLPAACQAIATFYTNEFGSLIITPSPIVGNCFAALPAATRVSFTIPREALLPNPSPQVVRFEIRGVPSTQTTAAVPPVISWVNNIDTATLKNQVGYSTVAECSTDAVPTVTFSSANDIASLSIDDRCALVAKISSLSQGGAAIKQCPLAASGTGIVTFAKFPEGTWSSALWPWTTIASLGGYSQQVGTTPPIAMLNWGAMFTYPMFSIIVTYPATSPSLQSLAIVDPGYQNKWRLAFIIRNDRLTLSCAVAALSNPWQFSVTIALPVVAVRHVGSGNNARATGSISALEALTLGYWAQRGNVLLVTVPQSGVVFGYYALDQSPIPGDGSDDALFGLLALIAVPVLLCCCLLALLWFLRPKAEACPCVPEYPVQEMYWVNAQPCAPTFSVAQCGPSTTPVYLVQ